MPATIVSRQCGFARNRSEAEYPHLWPDAGAWSPCLNPPGGTTLYDLGGRGNHGTLNNTESSDWSVLKGISAINYDGSAECTEIINASTLNFTGTKLTASSWVYPTGATADQKFFSMRGKFILGRVGTSLRVEQWAGSVPNFDSGSIPQDAWTLCVQRYDGATLKAYINGVETGSTALTGQIGSTTNNIGIAADIEGASKVRYFPGGVTDTLLWARALSANEIFELYRLGPGGWATPRRRRIWAPQADTATTSYIVGGGCASASGVI